jgi:4-hydroxy-tetrahydrodipicolinate synthase
MIHGVVPAILTPFRGGAIDLGLLDEHLGWLVERGVECVNAMGTTGEGPSLSLAERKTVVERVAAGPTDFIAGTGCTNLPETIELSRFALAAGARAALVVPPTYYEAQDLLAWYDALLDALPEDERVFLYHIPRFSHPIPGEVIRELAVRHGTMLAGIKDSSGDVRHTLGWLRAFPALTVASGDDSTAREFGAGGGRTVITATANVAPEEVGAALAGDVAAQAYVAAVRALAASVPREAALKLLLSVVSGIPRSEVRPPLAELTAEQERHVIETFAQLRSESHVGSR